ncbi:hypothetical protein NFI96_027320 [Prochilodus magdalenae]|nr:hypothetical protein NFI96_027320 [Prochilodus magdalenae]
MADSNFFLWLVLVGVIVITLTIVFIFIIVNMCIAKQAAKRRALISTPKQTDSSHEKTNLFTAHTDVEKPPPLPSRDQFLIAESRSNSYEEMPDCKDPLEIQASTPPQPVFIQCSEIQDSKSVSESYDDVEQLDNNVSQSYEDVMSIPDYLDLEDNAPVLEEQPQLCTAQTDSRESMASYDDIGEIDIGEIDNASEDYDDVG